MTDVQNEKEKTASEEKAKGKEMSEFLLFSLMTSPLLKGKCKSLAGTLQDPNGENKVNVNQNIFPLVNAFAKRENVRSGQSSHP